MPKADEGSFLPRRLLAVHEKCRTVQSRAVAPPNFSPAWFLPGPHAQTIWGRITRPRQLVSFRRELLETPDGDELVLDHLDAPVTTNLHFVLLHGLEGSSHSVYIQGLLAAIARHGHAATAMNFRSCARDPEAEDLENSMLPNRRPRLYHSGETEDFDFVIRTLAARSDARFVAFGASLGGNVILKWLGENPGQTMLSAAATVSVPYDLGAGARAMERTVAGRLYLRMFLAPLKKKVQRSDVAARIDLPGALRARNFREFDDAATAPLHGFKDSEDYYTRSSSIHFLSRIITPVLALNAEDDPFLPPEVLPCARAAASPSIEFHITPNGGHVGFVGGRAPWSCEYWAEELVVQWLAEVAR